MKFLIAAVFLGMAVLPGAAMAQSQPGQPENPYDVLGKALMPLFRVFVFKADVAPAPGPGHSMVLDAHIIGASKLPPEFDGQAVHIAISAPDRALVQAPISRVMFSLCRNGDDLWAAPGSQLQAILDLANGTSAVNAPPPPNGAGTPGKKKKDKSGEVLTPLVLPISEKELVFLPILFQVTDGGSETVAGQPCRVLNVTLMQQLSKALHADNWSGKLWISANYALVQIELISPGWNGTVAIDKLDFPDTLPDSTFAPPATDVMTLTPQQFMELIREAVQH
jgi:hypothetical protein